MRKQLGNAIRATWVKSRTFALWNFLHFTEHFGRRRLIETDFGIHDADRFKQVQRADAGDLCRRTRLIERHANEALRREIVDFVGFAAFDDTDRRPKICQIIFDQLQPLVLANAKLFQPPEVD